MMNQTAFTGSNATKPARVVYSALIAIVFAGIAAILLLMAPIRLPIGAMYWDSFLYIDAGHRILTGQTPSVDFFTPVGPLGYYLAALFMGLFPGAQTLLVSNWALLTLSLPLMAVIAWQTGKRSPAIALALTLPFLFFSLLPFNTTVYYPFPGIDGFGIYNRHGSQLLYLLVAALLFMRNQRVLGLVIATVMAALFTVKVTAFLAAAMLCIFAYAAGRVHWRTAIGSFGGFAILLASAEIMTGGVSAYVSDILVLLSMNGGTLLPRILQGASRTFGVAFFASLLALVLLFTDLPNLRKKFAKATNTGPVARFQAILDLPAFWVGAVLAAGIFYESQNTGNQELIFLWPIVVMIVMRITQYFHRPALMATIAVLTGCVAIPPIVNTTQHAARALVGAVKDAPLESENLGSLGAVVLGPEVRRQAAQRRQFYLDHQQALSDMADAEILPSFLLYSDFDYQVLWLQSVDEAVTALKALEDKGLTYQTVFNLDFTNPFAWLLGKEATRHVSIGADPHRTIPPLDGETIDAIANTDIVLVAKCPYTHTISLIEKAYTVPLESHRRVKLSPCYDMLVRPGIKIPAN
jgi:hypothetical protein